jgi:hypothetical protein
MNGKRTIGEKINADTQWILKKIKNIYFGMNQKNK